MATTSGSSSSGGIGICGATFIIFLILKLLNKITWSWWWITAPLWLPTIIVLGVLLIIGIVALIIHLKS